MRKMLTSVVVVAIAIAALSFVPLAWAEDVQGKIKSVDPTGRQVTLEDGTALMIPAAMKVDRQALQPGADVKASFDVKGKQKIVTAIQVHPAK